MVGWLGLAAADLVGAFGQVVGGNKVLTFDNGDVVQIDPVTDMAGLTEFVELS